MEKTKKWPFAIAAIGVMLTAVLIVMLSSKSNEEHLSGFVTEHQRKVEAIALQHLAGDVSEDVYKGITVDAVFRFVIWPYSGTPILWILLFSGWSTRCVPRGRDFVGTNLRYCVGMERRDGYRRSNQMDHGKLVLL